EAANGFDPSPRRRGTWLPGTGQRRVEACDGDVDGGGGIGRGRGDQVEVTLDERRLGDQRERVTAAREDLDDLPGDAQSPLDRLVAIGGGADADRIARSEERRVGDEWRS